MAPSKSALKSGRPPTVRPKAASLSKKATSRTIRSFHQLNKALSAAERTQDGQLAENLRRRIAELGGLESYQIASMQGQATDRGGDSSVVLMDWLRELKVLDDSDDTRSMKLRMLEVGALSTQNACSKSGIFDITRIDFNSQGDGILQQDFMVRPLPASEKKKFDVISLSLVLNFVPSPTGRGDMLKRTCQFLRPPPRITSQAHEHGKEDVDGRRDYSDVFPSLFLVLPSACTTNSRFLSDELLALIMASLGYVLRQRKQTGKLVYYLWVLRDRPEAGATSFGKREVNPGGARNNFCVVLEKGEG